MRNFTYNALILSCRISGESNKSVCVFSEDEGIFYTTLYGGPKSKMRSLVTPFNRGKIWIYRDESKKSSKITDFDVEKYHISFSQSLFKSQVSMLAAEIVMKTNCAGSPKKAFWLLNGFLDGLDASDENEGRIAFLRFVWRYLEILGIRPDAKSCAKCGKSFLRGEILGGEIAKNDVYLKEAFYSSSENGFICSSCTDKANISRETLIYLEAIATLHPKETRAISVTRQSFFEMRDLCLFILQNAIGSSLKTLSVFGEVI